MYSLDYIELCIGLRISICFEEYMISSCIKSIGYNYINDDDLG